MADYKPPTSAKELLERYAKGERIFKGAELAGANLKGKDIKGVDLQNSNLSRANLKRAGLSISNLAYANLEQADLSGADSRESNFYRANLESACLENAVFANSNFNNANLKEASLKGAYLGDTDFTQANLAEACLRDSWLCFARFPEANFERADLTNALLNYAWLGNIKFPPRDVPPMLLVTFRSEPAVGLTQEQVNSASGNGYTVLPPNLLRPRSWITRNKKDDDHPLLILEFRGDSEPKTLKAISRESTAWTDHFTTLASLKKHTPIVSVADIRTGSLALTLVPVVGLLSDFGNIWHAVKSYKKICKMAEEQKVISKISKERALKDEREKLIKAAIEALGSESEKKDKTIRSLFKAFLAFAENGGEATFYVPKPALTKHPHLKKLIHKIEEIE